MSVEVFVPCRAGSTRVPHKNTRLFADESDGLLGVKLGQLEKLKGATRVVVDSNDAEVLAIAERWRARWKGAAELVVRSRPDELGQSSTTTDALIDYALGLCQGDTLLWTHVTSPMADERIYGRALAAYAERDPQLHDSLMSVTPLRGFVWSDDGPLSYAREPIRWPRTQDVKPLYEINSAVFIVARALGRRMADRIGERPLLLPMDKLDALDVDWEEDFHIAEMAYRQRLKTQRRPQS